MDFEAALGELGFTRREERASRRALALAATPNPYLTYWVHALDDGTALFTWEFAVADYLASRGILLGSAESLNLFMFPAEDRSGPQDPTWVARAIEETERQLAAIDFSDPGEPAG
jgi:hypothetical protein